MLAPYISVKTAAVGSCLALLSGVLVASASAEPAPRPSRLVAASELGRAPLPAGDADRSVAGLERSALRLAAALDAVPVREGGPEENRYCPAASLRVQWTAPTPTYAVGAHLDPVGPAPDDRTAAVNGVVVCEGAGYAYMGFAAHWSGAAWVVTAVPSLSDEHGEHEEEHAEESEAHAGEARDHQASAEEHGHAEPAAAPPAPAPAPPAGLPGLGASAAGAVDPYARYDPQRTCDPVAKPGTSALSAMLLRTYPASRSLGLSRTCTARGVSEHKEGRAFDWGVNVGVPAQRAAAESALSQLLATDAAGNRHALARRLGVMYLIWDRKIWSAYNSTAGWRPYSGASPHTDHVHISLSWDGAMGRTSYWQGANASLLQLDPALQLAFDGGSGSSGSGGSGGSLPVAPIAHAPAQAGTAPQRRGGRDGKGRDKAALAPEPEHGAPEHGAPAVGVVAPVPGAHRDEREQRWKNRKEGKRREREAQETAAAAAAEAAAAEAAAAEAAAAAEQAAQAAAAPPAAGHGAGKGKRKAAAAPAPAEPPKASGKGSGGAGKAKAPEPASGGKGSAKGSGKGSGKGSAKSSGKGSAQSSGKGSAKGSGKGSATPPAAAGKGGGRGKGSTGGGGKGEKPGKGGGGGKGKKGG